MLHNSALIRVSLGTGCRAITRSRPDSETCPLPLYYLNGFTVTSAAGVRRGTNLFRTAAWEHSPHIGQDSLPGMSGIRM